MKDIENLIRKLSTTTKHEVFWLGAADQEQITRRIIRYIAGRF